MHACKVIARTCLLVWMAIIPCLAEQTAQREILLREHLGQKWETQLLFFPFETALDEQCLPQNIRVSGPNGPLPAQLVDVERWPETQWVKSAQLVFADALGPGETHRYRATWEPNAPPAPETSLRVLSGEGWAEFHSGRFGLRLPLGADEYAQPVEASQAPSPVTAMWLGDETPFGGSRLAGAARVQSWKAELQDVGPLLARWRVRYRYEDGLESLLRIELAAGDTRALWETQVEGDDPSRKWELQIDAGLPPLVLPIAWEHQSQRPQWKDVPRAQASERLLLDLAEHAPGLITHLTPWDDWWDDYTQTSWTFQDRDGTPLLEVERFDPGRWVHPLAPGTLRDWTARFRSMLPLVKRDDGSVALAVSAVGGTRAWLLGAAGNGLGRTLNVYKDYTLEWKPKAPHPRLFLTAAEIEAARPESVDTRQLEWMRRRTGSGVNVHGRPHASDAIALGEWLSTGDDKVPERTRLADRLRHHMNLLGDFDRMRSVNLLCGLYDGLIDSTWITAEERPRLRAQMAFLGYRMADPSTWSNERGYRSYNLNMSISYALNLGTIATTIPDHPMASAWAQSAVAMMEQFLADNVGPQGEWPESISNYAYVSVSSILAFAIMARNAGLADFVDDPRMKRLMLYLAKQYTPPDPRHTEGDKQGRRSLLPPVGRGGAGGTFGLAGAMARATAACDPDYSAVQQWVWERTGYCRSIANTGMGGWEWIYLDPSLPSRAPAWSLDHFPWTGAILRHGIGSPAEWYVYLMAEQEYAHVSESGGLPAVFARGVPISARFAGGYAEREQLLISRVLLSRDAGTFAQRQDAFDFDGERRLLDASALPRQQYVRGAFSIRRPRWFSYENSAHNRMKELPRWPQVDAWAEPPVSWNRQVLFVHDHHPDGVGYLVLRDTVRGDRPTMWQFWTVSETLDVPERLADREAALAAAPGRNMADARPLPSGSRYTALGQFGLDIEFYVAAPNDTPRHTLRWGTQYGYAPIHGYEEYQDMLHLQLPGDGTYFVAIFPRRPDEPVPAFRTHGHPSVLEVSGAFGRDIVFLNDTEFSVTLEQAAFMGTAASIQDRADGLVLSLGAPGTLSYRDLWVESRCPAALRQNRAAELQVDVPETYHGLRWVEFQAPGQWALAPGTTGVTLGQWPGTSGWLLQFNPGTAHALLLQD